MDRRLIGWSSALMLALAACGGAAAIEDEAPRPLPAGSGGNGGTGAGAGTGTPVVGALVAGGPVSGVSYSTETQSGVTDESGGFSYVPGEAVTFELGGTVLGVAIGDSVVDPFDLGGIEPPVGTVALRQRFADPDRYPEFHRAANIATLLQSLDQDIDPTNGVEITEPIRNRMSGVSLDLGGDLVEFRNQPNLNRLMSAIDASDELREPHGVRNPLYALQLTYDGLGISPEVLAPVQTDSTDSITHREYNEWGQEVSSATSYVIGIADSSHSYTYDDNGNELAFSSSSFIFSSSRESTYDVLGRRVTQRGQDSFGLPGDFAASHEYNEAGLVVRTTRDDDSDDSVDRVTTFEYDDQDRLVRTEIDEPFGGPVDRVIAEGYDEKGRHVSTQVDFDVDSLVDVETSTTYDLDGNRTREVRRRYIHTVTETLGGPILETIEDTIEVRRWTYDASGLVLEHTRSSDFEDPPFYRELRVYDERNRVTQIVKADRGRGNDQTNFDYNELDLLVEERRDSDDDGDAERTVRHEYDSAGNEVRRTIIDATGTTTLEMTNEPTGLAAAL